MNDPERRCRRWLRTYPKEYRDVRGEEILGTLLEASAGGGPSLVDLLSITAHGAWLRARVVARRLASGRLPRSVHIAAVLMAIFAMLNFLTAAFPQNGPKNPSSHLDNIIVGVVFIGLDLLLRTWNRYAYRVVIGSLAVVVATSLVAVDLLGDVYAVAPLVLLLVGRRRYAAAIPGVGPARPVPGRTAQGI